MPGFQSFEDGRLHVHVCDTHQFKTRHISLKMVRPLSKETATATAILPYLWMEGTTSLPSARQISQFTDDLFGTVIRTGISKRGDCHVLEAYASVPEESALREGAGVFGKALELVLSLIQSPYTTNNAFPAEHVARERGLHQKRIESVLDDKISLAMERLLEEVCRGLPSGVSRLGYLDEVNHVDGAQLWQMHQQVVHGSEVHLYLIGAFEHVDETGQQTLAQLRQVFPGHDENRTEPTGIGPLAIRGGDVKRVVDVQDVAQGKLNVGFRTNVPYKSETFLPLLVANGILGGGGFFHSKLHANVREKHSLAYYAASRLDGLTGIIAVQTGIEISRYEDALRIILEQVDALKNGHISDDELSLTLHAMRNQYLLLGDQPTSQAEIHFSGVLGGVKREVPHILEALEHMQKSDVVQAAQHIQLDTIYFLRNEEVKANA